MKLEIVQSGKIPKNQALLVYNRNLKTEEEARKEDDANLKDAEAAKFAEDPVEEFKAAARREITRDAVAGVRVAIQKGPMEGPVELTSKLLGYSKRNRSLEQKKRLKQIVAVREYLQELVKNQAAKKSGGPHVVRARGGEESEQNENEREKEKGSGNESENDGSTSGNGTWNDSLFGSDLW